MPLKGLMCDFTNNNLQITEEISLGLNAHNSVTFRHLKQLGYVWVRRFVMMMT